MKFIYNNGLESDMTVLEIQTLEELIEKMRSLPEPENGPFSGTGIRAIRITIDLDESRNDPPRLTVLDDYLE